MDINETSHIEKYLLKKLPRKEMEELEKRIATDDVFKKEVEEMRVLMTGVHHSGRKQLLEDLKKLDNRLEEATTSSKYHSIWRYAAAVLFLLMVSIWFFRKPANEKLFAAHFTTYENILEPARRSEAAELNALQKGLKLYDNEQFEAAADWLAKAYEQDSSKSVLFYLAIAHLKTNKTERSIAELETCLKLMPADHILETPSKWYLALSYIRLNQVQKALPLLEEIANNDEQYAFQAKTLMQEIVKR